MKKLCVKINIFLGILIFFFFSSQLIPQTNVNGLISTNTTWDKSGNPYIVTSNLLVGNSTTLTINPGVIIKFNSHTSLQIDGTIIALGEENDKIVFTSNSTVPAAGDWDYIYFSESSSNAVFDSSGNYVSGSVLEYVTVEYSGGGQVDNNGAVRLGSSSPYISHSEIKNNLSVGITSFNLSNDLRITNNILSENGTLDCNSGGIYIDYWADEGSVLIANNVIKKNTGGLAGGIYASVYKNALIKNNLIDSNYTGQDGAAINFYGNGNIDGNIISNNKAEGSGGGLFILWSNVQISNNIIFNNSCDYGWGGGIYIEPTKNNGFVEVNNNIISNNKSNIEGGGLYVLTGYAIGTPIYVMGNSFVGNLAPSSSAGYFSDSDKDVMNNLFTENETDSFDVSCTIKINHTPLFNYNNIFNNADKYELYNNNPQSYSNIDANSNWWGTTDNDQVSSMIYDWFVNSDLGITDHSTLLTSFNLDAPISPPTNISCVDSIGKIYLSWDKNSETDLAGYNIYWGSSLDPAKFNKIDVGNETQYEFQDTTSNKNYILITSYDSEASSIIDNPLTLVNEKQTTGHESWFALANAPKIVTDVSENIHIVPDKIEILQNYPNPFNPTTSIGYSISKESKVSLIIYDILGRKIKSLVDRVESPGRYNVEWNASNCPSGVYFYKFQAGKFSQIKKMLLVK